MALTIGVDIGGTKVAGGVVDDTGEVLEQTRRLTAAQDTRETLNRIVDVIRELAKSHEVESVGIGAAGWFDVTRSTVMFAPNLAWRNEPLRARIAEAIDLPIVMENDGNVAAWAEFTYGAARDVDDSMALVTVGTGIGGGLVIGGRLVRGAHGVAGEPGHTRAVPDGLLCRCGRRGCLEMYASGSALVRYARQAAAADRGAAAGLLDLAGGVVDAITGPMVTRAARSGDPVALGAFEQIGRWLGAGLADIVMSIDPQILVVGGGVAEAGDLLMRPTRVAFEEALSHRGRMPVAELRPALLGNTAGLIGAADLARRG